jgi:hypothetical protein
MAATARELGHRVQHALALVGTFHLSERRLRSRIAVAGVVGIATGLVTWPFATQIGPVGLDASFQIGLHMAVTQGLLAGTEIVSTYGPLGFLAFPQPYVGPTSAIAMAFAVAVHIALCTLLFWRAASAYPALLAALLALLGARAASWLGVYETALAIVFVASIAVLRAAAEGYRIPAWGFVAAGAAGGILALGKLNAGAVALTLVILTSAAASRSWWRGGALALAGAAASALLAWLALGQGVGNIVPFLASSASVALGYNAAMGLDQAATLHWMVWAATLIAGVLAFVAWEQSRTWSGGHRTALLCIGLLLVFGTGKAAFVRWHYPFAFATALVVVFAFIAPRVRLRDVTLGFITVLVGYLATTASTPADFVANRAEYVVTQAQTLVDPGRRSRTYETNVDTMRAVHAVEPYLLDLLEGQRTHLAPSEATIALVYPGLEWDPLPAFQDYFVYTPHLDDMNARALSTEDGPERILRQAPVAIDARYPWFEGPESQLALLCHFRELATSARWQVLTRSEDRCGDGVVVERVSGRVGEPIEVPNAPRDHILVAEIAGLDPQLPDALRQFLFKHDEWYITLDGAAQYRLVSGTAGQGLLMSAPDVVGYSAPFAPPPKIGSFTIVQGHGVESSEQLDVTFVAIPVDAPG